MFKSLDVTCDCNECGATSALKHYVTYSAQCKHICVTLQLCYYFCLVKSGLDVVDGTAAFSLLEPSHVLDSPIL